MDKDKSKEGEKDMDLKDNDMNSDEGLTKFNYKGKTIKEIIDAAENNNKFDDFIWEKEGNNILLRDLYGMDIEIIFINSIEVKYEIYKKSSSEIIKLIKKRFILQCKLMNF